VSDRRRWVCLDVGETLIDETRIWSLWADELGMPRLTFLAAFGAALARGGDYSDVFRLVGRVDWREHLPTVLAAYGGFRHEDLYPDAVPAMEALHRLGYGLAVVANQPRERTAELRALGIPADAMAMSDELGVHKPEPAFFARALDLMGSPDPNDVAYVGDRVDNDVRPSRAAGMHAVWLRRGPWGVIAEPPGDGEALVVDSLDELVDRIDEIWA
jgi:HAD superfamily hydrolase (TIGR01549 family)